MDIIEKCYKDLANAIIVQAANDYRALLNGAAPTNEMNIDEVERFFKSEWFENLTKVDGIDLMNRIRKECLQ